MGIERFFNSLKTKYGEQIINNIDIVELNSEYLFVDFNSIIHTISQDISDSMIKLYHYYLISLKNNNYILDNKNYIDSLLHNLNINQINQSFFDSFNKSDKLDIIIISKICEYILYLINLFKNLKYIYLAIDGVPMYAKQLEQKRRRLIGHIINKSKNLLLEYYKDELNINSNNNNIYYNHYQFELNIKKFKFDKNKISPATKFMTLLESTLNEFLIKCKYIQFYIDSYNNFGEGEKKICNQIHKMKIKLNSNITIYSPDADMILLMLLESDKYKVNILRYDQQLKKLEVIDINILNNIISNYISEKSSKFIIKDIVMIFTILGNDFLPKIEIINTNKHITKILDAYKKTIINKDFIFDNKINWKLLYRFFINLEDNFKHIKIEEIYRNKKWKINENQLINNNAINYYIHLFNLENLCGQYNPDKQNNKYSNKRIDENYMNTYIIDYLTGFKWLYEYYINYNEKYKLYSYNHSRIPTISQLIIFIDKINTKQIILSLDKYYIDDKKYFVPITQLLFITPMKIHSIVDNKLLNNHTKKIINKYYKLYKTNYNIKIINSKLNIFHILDCKNIMYINKCNIKNENKIDVNILLNTLN